MQKSALCAYVDCYDPDSPLGVSKVRELLPMCNVQCVTKLWLEDYEELGDSRALIN